MPINVLIADDSRFFRERISEILSLHSNIKIVGTAENGKEALEKALELKPDVITMDYEMPRMDGITAIREIMARQPTPILMFSSLSYEGARTTLDALAAGAVDFLPKNFESVSKDKSRANQLLIERVIQIAKPSVEKKVESEETGEADTPGNTKRPTATQARSADEQQTTGQPRPVKQKTAPEVTASKDAPRTSRPNQAPNRERDYKIVVIGASTGGPIAVQNILKQLPSNLPVPIILVQHMPAAFTKAYADRLDQLCGVTIQEAKDGMELLPSHVYVAPGGKQLMISSKGGKKIRIIDGDRRLHYKPSVDLTFASLAKNYPGSTLAIVMTGMGSDGADGARLLHQDGSSVWIQDQASCVVFGMPAAVMQSGYYNEIVTLDSMGEKLIAEVCR